MNMNEPLKEITTINFSTSNLMEAKQWYSDFFGIEPSFQNMATLNFE